MDIVDEDEKEEKGNEVDRQVTSSGVMEMSSTEEEVNPPPHPSSFLSSSSSTTLVGVGVAGKWCLGLGIVVRKSLCELRFLYDHKIRL
jgi:hypothetical protein